MTKAKPVDEALMMEVRHLGYKYPEEWLRAEPKSITQYLTGFDAGEKHDGTKTTKISFTKTDQGKDITKVLENPFCQPRYRFMIAEEAGVDNARKLAALIFAGFYNSYYFKKAKDPAAKPPRWLALDNNPQQHLDLTHCSALILDYYSYNSTSLKGEKVRDFISNERVPTILICSGGDPWKIISDKLNASFDAYAFLRSYLSRTL